MRFGILGPAKGDLGALARAAKVLLDGVHADKILYLGDDDALDQVITAWARRLVGGDPRDEALLSRAAAACAAANPEQIDRFVAREKARLRFRAFSSLPEAPSRTIEILDSRVILFVYDKAMLDEEDIVAASILVFGKSEGPVLRRVGARTFVSPGPIGCERGGSAVLDDDGGGVKIDLIDASGAIVAQDFVGGPRGGKVRVQGG
jgi:hypothetical protein